MFDFEELCKQAPAMSQDALEKALHDLEQCRTVFSKELEEKGRAKQDEAAIGHHGTSIQMPIPGEVLDQVCVSDFLTTGDCGRLLLLVSKSMLQTYGKHHAWEVLCGRKWKNIAHVPKPIILQRGYEWIFRQLTNSSHSHDSSAIRPPSLSYDTLTLLISIRNGATRKEVVSIALACEPLKTFLENGELNVSLKDKVSLGKYPLAEDGNLDFVAPRISKWTATLHLLRSDRAQCVCLHKTDSCSWGEYDYLEDPNIEEELQESKEKELKVGWNNTVTTIARPKVDSKIPSLEVDMGYLEFATSNGLELSRNGKYLEDRIRMQNTTGDTYECIKIEPTLICHTQDYCELSNSVDLISNELRLDAWKRYQSGAAELYQSNNESKKHGVTLLHLLSTLIDWEGE